MRHPRAAFAIAGTLGLFAASGAWGQARSPASPPLDIIIPAGNIVVRIEDASWQVALVARGAANVFLFCGGSLIAPGWVLTTAACVDNPGVAKDPARVDVIAGTLTYKSSGVRSAVDKIFVHPEWRQTDHEYDFDAALIKLKTPITMVAPINVIAPTGTFPAAGQKVRVTGWGAVSEGGPISEQLRFIDVPVVSNAECNKPESYDGRVTARMFCAGEREGGRDSCQGDGGGPVAFFPAAGTMELVGIVSWGFGCARALKYGVYTRVSSVAQWVSATMASN